MADQRKARPVSGEIMTAGLLAMSAGQTRPDVADAVDADYEVVASAQGPSANELPYPELGFIPASPPVAGMDMLRRPNAPVLASTLRGGPIFWIAGLGLAAMAFWVSGGHAIVRRTPLLATWEEPVTALRISGITSRVDVSGRKPLLFVDGEAVNDGPSAVALPPLEIKVAANDGRILRYRLGTSGAPMASGERFAFSSRLDVPKDGVKTVSVAFVE